MENFKEIERLSAQRDLELVAQKVDEIIECLNNLSKIAIGITD